MKKPASFHTATTISAGSTVSGEPSQLCAPKPSACMTCSSRPYCGV
jgi:hypothetical protein